MVSFKQTTLDCFFLVGLVCGYNQLMFVTSYRKFAYSGQPLYWAKMLWNRSGPIKRHPLYCPPPFCYGPKCSSSFRKKDSSDRRHLCVWTRRRSYLYGVCNLVQIGSVVFECIEDIQTYIHTYIHRRKYILDTSRSTHALHAIWRHYTLCHLLTVFPKIIL